MKSAPIRYRQEIRTDNKLAFHSSKELKTTCVTPSRKLRGNSTSAATQTLMAPFYCPPPWFRAPYNPHIHCIAPTRPTHRNSSAACGVTSPRRRCRACSGCVKVTGDKHSRLLGMDAGREGRRRWIWKTTMQAGSIAHARSLFPPPPYSGRSRPTQSNELTETVAESEQTRPTEFMLTVLAFSSRFAERPLCNEVTLGKQYNVLWK